MRFPIFSSQRERDHVLIFVHVPKAAGSTLRWILDRQYSEAAVYRCDMHLYDSAFADFRNLSAEQISEIRCLIGHLPYGLHEFIPGPAKYVTVLRDPIDRFLSEFNYLRNNEWVAKELDIDERHLASPESFVDLQRDRNAMNFQTRQIAGSVNFEQATPPFAEPVSNQDFETAKNNIVNAFSVVGLQERFDESLLLMKHAFGWRNVCYLRQNVASRPVPKDDMASQTRNLIEKHNEFDTALYAFAERRFEKQIQEYGPHFSKDLDKQHLKNKRYFGRKSLWSRTKDLILRAENLITNRSAPR